MPVRLEDLRKLYLALPEVREGTTYGTISFAVHKTFLGRMRDDDTVFAMRVEFGERDMLLEIEPDVFFTTDHYRGYPYVLIRLERTTPERLAPLVERAWRHWAPKRLIRAFDGKA